jgi:magnesium-transporting ATPase (P-type)
MDDKNQSKNKLVLWRIKILLLSYLYAFAYFLLMILFPSWQNALVGHDPRIFFSLISFILVIVLVNYYIKKSKELKLPYLTFSFVIIISYSLVTYGLSLLLQYCFNVDKMFAHSYRDSMNFPFSLIYYIITNQII